MREIKFRAWSKENKKILMNAEKMYDGLGTWFDNHGKEIDAYAGFPTSSFGEMIENEDIILMQFTGLLDKNNKEIYEGDIVKGIIKEPQLLTSDTDENCNTKMFL